MGQQSEEVIDVVVKRTRRWRVGTVSMGLSLVLLGVLLFLKQALDVDMIEPILVWWPMILIVLGLEIIVYLMLIKQENPVVKYDFVSIIFIALLGSAAIVFTIFSSLGVLGDLQTALYDEAKTYELPRWEERIPAHIDKIIVVSGRANTHIDQTQTDELHIMGTYRTSGSADQIKEMTGKQDVAFTQIVGDTIYVYMKDTAWKNGPFSNYNTYVNATIVVPERLELETR